MEELRRTAEALNLDEVEADNSAADAEQSIAAAPARLLHVGLLLGTTTTGSSLVHCKLYWVPACAQAASKLQSAWRAALAELKRRSDSGELCVLLVANLGKAGKEVGAETRKRHIHTTLNHAGQRAAFLLVNEYGWSSNGSPGGCLKVQSRTGCTLTPSKPRESPPTLQHGGGSGEGDGGEGDGGGGEGDGGGGEGDGGLGNACTPRARRNRGGNEDGGDGDGDGGGGLGEGGAWSRWCYPAHQEPVFSPSQVASIPGTENESCHNIIASRRSGAFFLEKMPNTFYQNLPEEAYCGRFVCCKATWCDERRVQWRGAGTAAAGEQPPSHFLLATWHGPHKGTGREVKEASLRQLCAHLSEWCDQERSLCCILAGDFNIELRDFNIELPANVAFSGFIERLDPDKRVSQDGLRTERPHPHRQGETEWSADKVRQWAGRRRNNGKAQRDVDHMLVYRPVNSPLEPRRPRRFRMYDRARAGVLPRNAGAVTHEYEGALDHDSLVLELWLRTRRWSI